MSLIVPPVVVIPDNVIAFYGVEPTNEIKAPYVATEAPIYQQKLDTRDKVKEYARWSAGMIGTDVNLALDLLKWESTYCEKPWNNWPNEPMSTAKGCFMFLEKSTWQRYCSGDIMNKKDNISCAVRMLYDPKLLRHWSIDPNICRLLIEHNYLNDETEC